VLRAGWIQGEGSIISGVQTTTYLTPPLGAFDTLTIIENRLEIRKLSPPKVKGVRNLKKQITTKVGS
jgi:hypothetical protein